MFIAFQSACSLVGLQSLIDLCHESSVCSTLVDAHSHFPHWTGEFNYPRFLLATNTGCIKEEGVCNLHHCTLFTIAYVHNEFWESRRDTHRYRYRLYNSWLPSRPLQSTQPYRIKYTSNLPLALSFLSAAMVVWLKTESGSATARAEGNLLCYFPVIE